MSTGEAITAVIGGVLLLLQGLGFFILTDLRERIMRLETGQMAAAKIARGG